MLIYLIVSATGTVAIVHNPNLGSGFVVDPNADYTNTNFFKVIWQASGYPDALANCDGIATCQNLNGIECVCDITLEDHTIFTSIPSGADVVSQLKVGGLDAAMFDGDYVIAESGGGVTVWHKDGMYNQNTIFEYAGKFYKNVRSDVKISNSQFAFRNPPQFLNPVNHENRDAEYETEAVLQSYFTHPNVAPFIAHKMIQRFGVSNPSPNYVESAASAFNSGTYSSGGLTFGSGAYGDMEAMVAAIVLHDEANHQALEADPFAGSLKEPLIKLISFMRGMEFEQVPEVPSLSLVGLQDTIGQEAHSIPNVFSFFLPEYQPPGHIKAAMITAPEAQVMTGPNLISLLNGFFSLVDLGLTTCYGGFGELTQSCPGYLYGWYDPLDSNRGFLQYTPVATTTASIVDELALILTGGRLHDAAKNVIISAYDSAPADDKLKVAQKLIISTPEFHSNSGIFDSQATTRPDVVMPPSSGEPYKAIVFLNLDGGADSFNMLVPKACSKLQI